MTPVPANVLPMQQDLYIYMSLIATNKRDKHLYLGGERLKEIDPK